MVVFWTKGYDGTTIPDLTAALGVNRPSLYAAFGNKESLFRASCAACLSLLRVDGVSHRLFFGTQRPFEFASHTFAARWPLTP